MRLGPHDRLGPYEAVRPLGSGGFAETYEARHALLCVKACLKRALSPRGEDLLLHEAKVLSCLRHPSLPSLREVFFHEGSLVLAMSFAEGKDLSRYFPLPPVECSRIGCKVLRALNYLHKGGIVHGDVKPKNVIVASPRKGGDVVLVDLGLATVRPGSKSRAPGWTEGFAAPEVESGLPPLPESDLYSLAKTLECSLEGEPPERLEEWLTAATQDDPARRPRPETKDPLFWLERVQRSLEREEARV